MRVGNVATGIYFYNRVNDLLGIWDVVNENHMVISGPRRLGKSSLLYKIVEQAPDHGFTGQLVDVEGCDTAIGFIECLNKAFPTMKGNVKSTLDKLNPFGYIKSAEGKVLGTGGSIELKETTEKTWKAMGDTLLTRLAQKKNLILVDEFSVFMEKLLQRNPKEAEDLLGWLRGWRQNQQAAFKFVLTGSIGLQSLLQHHGLETYVNDCYDFVLGPFKTPHAKQMLQSLADKNRQMLDDETAAILCQRIGWLSPYFLNLLLDESIKAARDRQDETENESNTVILQHIVEQDITQAYEMLVASRSHFSHWEGRLKNRLQSGEFSFCQSILTHIAKSDNGLTLQQLSARLQSQQTDVDARQALLQTLLLKLTEEGYLSSPNGEGRIEFLSFLIRDHWKRNHV
jgi:hypothetical protein